jgi:hypothetical protein
MEKTIAVYMTVVRSKQNEFYTATIRLQFDDGSGLFHTFNDSESVTPVRLLPLDVFSLIPDEPQRKVAQKRYEAELDLFETTVDTECEKARQALKSMGYGNIINAYAI